MKNHFPFPYVGNKRQELDFINTNAFTNLIENINTVVEPFCGSCAFSYQFWFHHEKGRNKQYKYILNDNNGLLIQLLNVLKFTDQTEMLLTGIREFIMSLNKEKYNILRRKNTHNALNLVEYVVFNKCYNVRIGIYDEDSVRKVDLIINKIKNAPIIEFLRTANIEILQLDAIKIYEMYKFNHKSLLYQDPPYINSTNYYYRDPCFDIFEHIFNDDMKMFEAIILFHLEDTFITKLLTKDRLFEILKYAKTYEITKRKTTHILLSNKLFNIE
jgi:site-specific DNA-adenine methylase